MCRSNVGRRGGRRCPRTGELWKFPGGTRILGRQASFEVSRRREEESSKDWGGRGRVSYAVRNDYSRGIFTGRIEPPS